MQVTIKEKSIEPSISCCLCWIQIVSLMFVIVLLFYNKTLNVYSLGQ